MSGKTETSYSDERNFNRNFDINWLDYNIDENDVNSFKNKNNYHELSIKYKDNMIFIQMYFVYSKLDPIIKKDIVLPIVFQKLQKQTNLGLKNPYLLLLGYWVNLNKSQIYERFNHAISDMSIHKGYNVEPADLIRYCNFWNK